MSRVGLAALFFVLGLLAGVYLAFQLRPAGVGASMEAGAALDLRIRSGGTYRVRSVIDGDTVVLENGMHLRYSGVNAPESGRFVKDPAPKAAEATARNRALVEGKDVRVELAREPLDLHGRALARVYIKESDAESERDVGEILVREGLARAMPMGSNDDGERLREAQAKAKTDGVGMWGLAAGAGAPETLTERAKAFVASGGSAVYHAAECAIGRRIKPENVRGYASRADAEAAGLKACETCATKNGKLETE